MKFEKAIPKVDCLKKLNHFNQFLQLGQEEFCKFLINFLNLQQVRIQAGDLDDLKSWLKVKEIDEIMEVPENQNEICIVSQIQTNGELIAYFPYVLKGRDVRKYFNTNSLLSKLAEAISEQITLCYLQDFRGGDWIFGENLARMIVSNCISTREYDSIKFAHLIEKMEQLATATFEGQFFPTGVIVSENLQKYKENYFEFNRRRKLDKIDKREWFLANGQESFFLLDFNTNSAGIFRKSMPSSIDFINRYFDEYYLVNDLKAPDFIVRTVGANEISVSDSDGKEFVKIENIWRYRHTKNITKFLVEELHIEFTISYAILYYILRCSRNHISSIIWLPNDCSEKAISELTISNIKIWKEQLSILNESHQVLVDKILASDGAIVIGKDGKVLYESVFVDMGKSKESNDGMDATKITEEKLTGTGETAAQFLAQNGVAIKISQDGTIKVFAGDEKTYY